MNASMITIPLYTILFAYLLFLLIFVIFFLVNAGHLAHTGTFTFVSFTATFLFMALAVVILWLTWYLLSGVNWQEPLITLNLPGLTNLFSPPSF